MPTAPAIDSTWPRDRGHGLAMASAANGLSAIGGANCVIVSRCVLAHGLLEV